MIVGGRKVIEDNQVERGEDKSIVKSLNRSSKAKRNTSRSKDVKTDDTWRECTEETDGH